MGEAPLAYPIAWPAGWPRTPENERKDGSQFTRPHPAAPWSWDEALDRLYREIEMLNATSVIVSTNFARDVRGNLRPGRQRPTDQGIAVYFVRKGAPKVMACDRFVRAEHNMRSLTLAIEAMRALERHGGGIMMDRAFEGFVAIEAPGKSPWWRILQVAEGAPVDQIEASFRRLARERHPDRGGSDAMMAELNAARAAGLRAHDQGR